LGVQDYEAQAEVFNEQLAIAILKNNARAIKELQQKIELLSKYGGAYVALREILDNERKRLSLLKAKYDEVKADAETILQHKFIVNRATPSEKKAYPIRWLIVVVSTIATFVMIVIILILYDQIKHIRLIDQQEK
jgi:hypothetical protein